MPYGDERYILASMDIQEFRHMPPQACFHPFGVLQAYKELIQSIQKKEWKSKLFFETGSVEKEKVEKIVPKGLEWDYKSFENYSVSIVQL
jgi:hypothetical protein